MVKIAQSQVQRLLYLYDMWKVKGDAQNSARLGDVIRKYAKQEFMIAFCGHFSAGKSTMMNYLYGEDLLPTSPIPTSANVVKIQRGENRVVLTLKSGEQHAYEGAYTDEQLKQLCKNGDEVIDIHITRTDAALPEGVMLVDTPGIDSTDDAHKLATESALHLADVIFYMMDYNHVQSEVNLQFVKELKDRQKRVYLIVNQIDKHKEEELTFEAYADSVAASFANWNISTDGIFYTSLRNRKHPHNEIAKLENLIEDIMKQRMTYMEESADKEASYLLKEHERFLYKNHQEEMEEMQEDLSGASLQEAESALAQLYEQEQQLLQSEKTAKTDFLKGLDHILQNAYLLPFDVRSLAEAYLETELSNFKVGLFFSKAKTQKEKEQRLLAFYEKFRETAQAQLDFHVKEYILAFLQEQGIYTEEAGRQAYEISASFEPALLTDNVKRGAGLTGDYVLNYTNDVAAAVKKLVRDQTAIFMEQQFALLAQKWQQELANIQREIIMYEKQKTAYTAVKESAQSVHAYIQELYDVWEERKQPEIRTIDSLLEEQTAVVSKPLLIAPQEQNAVEEMEEKVIPATAPGNRVHAIVDYVKKAEAVIGSIPAFQHLHNEMMEKRSRVETKQFTVALFGAFSAGKSSFANALLGAKVLPVSPNPTTAAINKIVPVTSERPHGTVLVQLKAAETLLQDLQLVYKMFEKNVSSLQEAIDGIPELLGHPSPSGRQKTTLSFLRAVQAGYPVFAEHLGEMLETNIADFAEYVANEEKSCFVEYMELYYDCEFTRKGITLVDTPGADSVNARHTDVAFQYIKNADAILFVTYYNHVFSRADREFLIQLGRVKDSFAMDKMFFLVNAADLAATPDELQTVKDYISGQLLQYGIRHPRLFAVSSLFALDEKLGKSIAPGQYGIMEQSGMQHFEEAFTSFIMRDLMLVSLVALQGAVHACENLLHTMITNALEGNEQKEAKRRRYEKEREFMQRAVSSYSVLTEEQALMQEIRELLYYVKQRVFFRYNDVFTEIFNPAILRADNGDVKQRLRECVMEMIDFLKHDLMQEMRATSLRVESWMNKKLEFSKNALKEQCLERNEYVSFSDKDAFVYSAVHHAEPFVHMEAQQFKKAMSYFKNAKSFFEKNEKVLFQDEMKLVLDPEASQYIQEEAEILTRHYAEEWQAAWQNVKDHLQEDITQYFEGVLHALSEDIDVSLYEQAKENLQQIRKAIDEELNMV